MTITSPKSRARRGTNAPSGAARAHEPGDAIRTIEARLAAGDVRAALDGVNRLLRAAPGLGRAHGLLGEVALALGQPAMALAPIERALTLDDRFEHRLAAATCLRHLDRRPEAAAQLAACIRMAPPTCHAQSALGALHEAFGDHAAAAHCYAEAAALAPDRADVRDTLGRLRLALHDAEGALEACTAAVAREGTHAGYRANLSAALATCGLFERARQEAAIAVEIAPDHAVAHGNLGHALLQSNRSREAVAAYETALALKPDLASARFGLAMSLLKAGDFARGWAAFEARWETWLAPRQDLAVPRWNGEALGGRTILVWGEQGLGDMLQFVRFVPLVAASGGRVVLQVPRSLVRLLGRVPGVAATITDAEPMPAVDLHCPICSLPAALGIDAEAKIPTGPYLEARREDDPAPSTWFRPAGEVPVVGLVWAGDPRPDQPAVHRIDGRRSVAPETLAPLLTVPGIRFASFQYGASAGARARLGAPVADALAGIGDFAGTAARLAQVDLLIGVDTSTIHLAAALGVPTWMMSRFDGCWRWLEARGDSPWYPSMRIFRQASPGDWGSVVAEIRDALVARGEPVPCGN